MTQKVCEKCGESVAETKAFCPSCGHAFVEEERRNQPSSFEAMDGTMQLGQTMYNNLLSDMGLNLKEKTRKPAASQVVVPAAAAPPVPATVVEKREAKVPPDPREGSSTSVWIWILVAASAVLVFILAVAAILGVIWWLGR